MEETTEVRARTIDTTTAQVTYSVATSTSNTNLAKSQNKQSISLVGKPHFTPPEITGSYRIRRPSNHNRTSRKEFSAI